VIAVTAETENMVGTIFLIVFLIALANICSDLVMRIRLSKRLPSENRLSWFMRSSNEVGRTSGSLSWKLLALPLPVYVLATLGHRCCHAHFPLGIEVAATGS
jgi:hypothetical protein